GEGDADDAVLDRRRHGARQGRPGGGRSRPGDGLRWRRDMPGKILVADDSPNIREILKISLEGDGYTVVLAEDGEMALAVVAQEKPDLLIMDVMMPKVNGFQVCRRVKTDRATHDVPVIMLSAKSAQQDVYWGKDCGADEYMTKPFSTMELVKTIERLLRLRQQRQAGHASGVVEEL